MHPLMKNLFLIKILKDLAKFFVNIKGMDIVRKNTKKSNFKKNNLDKAIAFVENFSLGFVLTL